MNQNAKPSQADIILDIAERRMRQMGYNAVSYRDIAAEIGIKSASLHYHFPKKQDLGIALVNRYTDNFRHRLTLATQNLIDPSEKIEAFIELCRQALGAENLICLCAVLGAEGTSLPNSVNSSVETFFDENILWLSGEYKALGFSNPINQAKAAMALIEGAMVITSVKSDLSVFDAAAKWVTDIIAQH